MMKKLLLLTLIILSTQSYAFDYGKVRITLPENKVKHSLSLASVSEQSNDLITSSGIELRYLYSISQRFRLGLNYSQLQSNESENGTNQRKILQSNGVIQELDYKTQSVFIESQYRIAWGMMNLLDKKQCESFIDIGFGLGQSTFEKSNEQNEFNLTGISYGLEIGTIFQESYALSLQFKRVEDGPAQDESINQSYLGARVEYLW